MGNQWRFESSRPHHPASRDGGIRSVGSSFADGCCARSQNPKIIKLRLLSVPLLTSCPYSGDSGRATRASCIKTARTCAVTQDSTTSDWIDPSCGKRDRAVRRRTRQPLGKGGVRTRTISMSGATGRSRRCKWTATFARPARQPPSLSAPSTEPTPALS